MGVVPVSIFKTLRFFRKFPGTVVFCHRSFLSIRDDLQFPGRLYFNWQRTMGDAAAANTLSALGQYILPI